MNQNQIKYARQRIEEIFGAKKKEIEEKYAQKPRFMTFDEKIEAIKNGAFDRPAQERLEYILFHAQKRDDDLDVKKKEVHKKLSLEKDKIVDELMLGEAEEALQALNKFNNFKV